ncbi:hypothetical protein Taro_015471 [Colocasia esculenta]|uniref:Uncharacterized protein n=1 Tax=Colocasia esculenta TaxID=4460 RepID=A0A843UTB0_COLES|nr:hypothetical protein [Colocasia esculenta]
MDMDMLRRERSDPPPFLLPANNSSSGGGSGLAAAARRRGGPGRPAAVARGPVVTPCGHGDQGGGAATAASDFQGDTIEESFVERYSRGFTLTRSHLSRTPLFVLSSSSYKSQRS